MFCIDKEGHKKWFITAGEDPPSPIDLPFDLPKKNMQIRQIYLYCIYAQLLNKKFGYFFFFFLGGGTDARRG